MIISRILLYLYENLLLVMKHFVFTLILFTQYFFCNSQSWTQVGLGTNGSVNCMIEYNGELFIGGGFTQAGGQVVNRIVKWDGASYIPVGSGTNSPVYNSIIFNNELYLQGGFNNINGVPLNYGIARWDGINWSSLPINNNISPPLNNAGYFDILTVYNNKLIFGGSVSGSYLFSWDGVSVDTLPGSLTSSYVPSLTTYNNNLIAHGQFGGNSGNGLRLSMWNGISWTDIQGLTTGNVYIKDMEVYNNELYVTGIFNSMGGLVINNIAKWNGATWSNLGTQSSGLYNGLSLHVYNNELYVGGEFVNTDFGHTVRDVMKWNGSTWSDVSKTNTLYSCGEIMSYNSKIYAAGGYPTVVSGLAWLDPSATHILETMSDENISIHPNPTNSTFTISGITESEISSIEILDITGKLLFKTNSPINIDLSNYENGVYLFRIIGENNYTGKIVKE